jgi:hypothetical protein
MNLAVINFPVEEFFSVVDSSSNFINGLDSTSITTYLFNPAGIEVSSSIHVTITGLGNGHYIASFTPNTLGIWLLTLVHPIYFPWGKSNDIEVYTSDFTRISDQLNRVLGLVHQNVYIDQPTYDSDNNLVGARLRIYTDKTSVGTNLNVLATYTITSVGDGPGRFTHWEQVEI